ncbi:MAG: CoA transferase [Burkholderiaceae bacterium]|nr:CoA transferase [Burkholderiaceae bacterium]
MTEPSQGVLDGVRVLDFTTTLAGPYATRLMADLGADVIKVETERGDHARTRPPLRDGSSTYFGHMNHGKRSVVLDLKSPNDRQLALKLASHADVVVENWRPGVAASLGVGYGDLVAHQPRIVYCSISGYGQCGPGASRPAYAPLVHAASGFDLANMALQGTEKPQTTGIFIADIVAGMAAFGAIQAALFRRERTGKGDFIDVALMDAMLNLMVFEIQDAQTKAGARAVYPPLKARDGFIVIVPATQEHYRRLSIAAGHPEWLTDVRFDTLRARDENWTLMMNLIEKWTSLLPGTQVEALLLEAGVPCALYRTVAEALADPQILSRRSLTAVSDGAGEFVVPRAPFQFASEIPPETLRRVPALGEHTAEVAARMPKR